MKGRFDAVAAKMRKTLSVKLFLRGNLGGVSRSQFSRVSRVHLLSLSCVLSVHTDQAGPRPLCSMEKEAHNGRIHPRLDHPRSRRRWTKY